MVNHVYRCQQRDCAADNVCCDRANLRALAEGSMLAHVMGHNFAPFAFQKPRLGLLAEQTVLYSFTWGLVGALEAVWKGPRLHGDE